MKEMAEVEKENRLRRFTEAVDEGRVTKAPIFHTASNIVYDDTKVRMLVPDQYQLKLTTTLFWSLKVLLKTKLLKKFLQTQLKPNLQVSVLIFVLESGFLWFFYFQVEFMSNQKKLKRSLRRN